MVSGALGAKSRSSENFQPVNTMRLVVGSNMYPSIGLNVSYGIFSIGYTVDLPTLFSPITSSSQP